MKKIHQSSQRKSKPVRAYYCKCGAWHLTSRPDVFALQREIDQLKADKLSLENEIKLLKSSSQKEESMKIKIGALADARVKEQKHEIQRLQLRLKEAKRLRDDLFGKLNSYRNKYGDSI